jgi:hypothetical protein
VSDKQVDGYRDAANHLLSQGFAPAPNAEAMRRMWNRGDADKRTARRIADAWPVVA